MRSSGIACIGKIAGDSQGSRVKGQGSRVKGQGSVVSGLIALPIQMRYKIVSRDVGARHCRALTDVPH
ncbi:MAG: hypothetical protein ACFKPT_20035 [Gloeotrichia echinulata GP01]